jgi:hypothetical protein
MKCCDLSAEVTGCLLNATDVSPLCECCPLAEKLSGCGRLKESLEEAGKEEFEETLI